MIRKISTVLHFMAKWLPLTILLRVSVQGCFHPIGSPSHFQPLSVSPFALLSSVSFHFPVSAVKSKSPLSLPYLHLCFCLFQPLTMQENMRTRDSSFRFSPIQSNCQSIFLRESRFHISLELLASRSILINFLTFEILRSEGMQCSNFMNFIEFVLYKWFYDVCNLNCNDAVWKRNMQYSMFTCVWRFDS